MTLWRCFLVGVLAFPFVCIAAEEAKPKPPEGAALRQAGKVVRDVYQEAITAAKTPEQKLALAKKLIEAGVAETKDAAGRYTLFVMAKDIAVEVGDLDAVWSALEEMSKAFEVDELKLKVEALAAWEKRPRSREQREQFFARAAAVIDVAMKGERFDLARQAAAQAVNQARLIGDAGLIRAAGARAEEVRSGETSQVQAKKATAALKDKPDDLAANLTLGKYTCFVRGDWAEGLPMLVKGSDRVLKGLAELDLADPKTTDERVKLGDGWWEAAEKATGMAKSRMRARAGYWLELARPQLTGLAKARVEKRLASLAATERPSIPAGMREPIVLELGDGVTMKFVYIPRGQFLMGSPPDEKGRRDDETQHPVLLSRAFYMGVTEVTQAQWKAVMGANPPANSKGDDLPMNQASWLQAREFCLRLSQKVNRPVRLPTEAEWEYACRAGTTGMYGGSNELQDMAWIGLNSNRTTHPVAQKKPNPWGLYDMHGNVWEWCFDASQPYASSPVVDPVAIGDEKSQRARRGGCWDSAPDLCRAAQRAWSWPEHTMGFRCVLESR